jgi:hypothetical protein
MLTSFGILLRPRQRKIKFSPREDELLTHFVKQYGTGQWNKVAAHLKGRNARQCRDRWLGYVAPNVSNGPWTPEEEELLIRMYNQFGPKWQRIATFFKGRTDINVKNRWMLMERRFRRGVRLPLQDELKIPQRPRAASPDDLIIWQDVIADDNIDGFCGSWDLGARDESGPDVF